MGDRGVKLVAWLAAISTVSSTLAALLLSRATTPLSKNAWFVFCVVIAIISFAVLLAIGPIAGFRWWHEWRLRKGRSLAEVMPPVPAVAPSGAEDHRIPVLRNLITEGKMLSSQLPDPKNWTLADPIPRTLYQGLDALDERAAAVLEPGWMEQFRNDPPDLWLYAVTGGANGCFACKINSRVKVLETIIKDLQGRP